MRMVIVGARRAVVGAGSRAVCQGLGRVVERRWLSSKAALEPPRVNQVGIQYLSEQLHRSVFPMTSPSDYTRPRYPELLEMSQQHLRDKGLLGKKTQIADPINIENMPPLLGKSMDEHFFRIGSKYSEPYLGMAEQLLNKDREIPEAPTKWQFKAGWVRYAPGKSPQKVDYPLEDELVFDVEVMYKRSHYPVICTCVSSEAWYGWVSPLLTNYAKDDSYDDWEHLIPFNCQDKPKLLIGHNTSYDRARVLEEYNIVGSKAFYLDTMALHVAISGICSQQRVKWMKHKKNKKVLEEDEIYVEGIEEDDKKYFEDEIAQDVYDDPWLNKGSTNSLANVADFHCNIKLDKDDREFFSSKDPDHIIGNFDNLMSYCSKDVAATFAVAKKLFPEFRRKVPHPVSFSSLKLLGSLILPTTHKWEDYVRNSEKIYQHNREQVSEILRKRANQLIQFVTLNDDTLKPNIGDDPWLSQLNWQIKEKRYKKNGEPAANQAYLTGYPEWYRELFKSVEVDGEKKREMSITVRSRVTPLLLKLKWEGYPLIWTDSAGWCFKVPYTDAIVEEMEAKNYTKPKLNEEEFAFFLDELRGGTENFEIFKVPHPDGPNKRCTSIMSKSYLKFFESGVLTSEYKYAQEILSLNSTASYWMGNRSRIMEQFVVYNNPKKNSISSGETSKAENEDIGLLIPKLCAMGTITRRATENTWLTASNAKSNRIGSELKSLIQAPEGYSFVGADVDSEELWIASLIGDSVFNIHGGTALGWMTLEGDKNEKTDLHSKTAEIMGISRNDAKVFNYGRIYGAGAKFATRLLKQCNSSLSDEEAGKIANKLYLETKGEVGSSKFLSSRLYYGGSESVIFNMLEKIAHQEDPKTPALGASITDALTAKNLNKNNYLTSRVNWTIQSSGVDYLDLLITSMEYLTDRFNVDARLMLTVHDEVRYMVRSKDKVKAALLLQISNLWTRAMFCEQVGIHEVPQSCAFFSEVDIDHVLRKEVDLSCVTPSQPNPIPPGQSMDIRKLLDVAENGKILGKLQGSDEDFTKFKYVPRVGIIPGIDSGVSDEMKIAMTRLQISRDKSEWRKNVNSVIRLKRQVEKVDVSVEQTERYAARIQDDSIESLGKRKRQRKTQQEVDISADGNALLESVLSENATVDSTVPAKTVKTAPVTKSIKSTKAGAKLGKSSKTSSAPPPGVHSTRKSTNKTTNKSISKATVKSPLASRESAANSHRAKAYARKDKPTTAASSAKTSKSTLVRRIDASTRATRNTSGKKDTKGRVAGRWSDRSTANGHPISAGAEVEHKPAITGGDAARRRHPQLHPGDGPTIGPSQPASSSAEPTAQKLVFSKTSRRSASQGLVS